MTTEMSNEGINNLIRPAHKYKVSFVDHEPALCKEIEELLTQAGFKIHCYTSPDTCLEQLGFHTCDLLITDYNMPEMSGIALLQKAKRILPWLPVLIITGNGDIPHAVSAIQAGAEDFLEKPLNTEFFLTKIKRILYRNYNTSSSIINSLTKMEKRVFALLMEGKNNKEIALLLNRSRRTVENHRARLMKKLGAHNIAGLIKNAAQAGIVNFME